MVQPEAGDLGNPPKKFRGGLALLFAGCKAHLHGSHNSSYFHASFHSKLFFPLSSACSSLRINDDALDGLLVKVMQKECRSISTGCIVCVQCACLCSLGLCVCVWVCVCVCVLQLFA